MNWFTRTIMGIEERVGPTGRKTLIASFTPIRFEGCTISHAAMYWPRHKFSVGDEVRIRLIAGSPCPYLMPVFKGVFLGDAWGRSYPVYV